MGDDQADGRKSSFKSRLGLMGLGLLGIAAFVAMSAALEKEVGIPFDNTYRLACAAACLLLINKLRSDYPNDSWPPTSLFIALLINIGIFFTPLVERPSSRGELMLFALPDAVVVLLARIVSYRVTDDHQRSKRQAMTVGLVVASIFCSILFAVTLIQVHNAHQLNGRGSVASLATKRTL